MAKEARAHWAHEGKQERLLDPRAQERAYCVTTVMKQDTLPEIARSLRNSKGIAIVAKLVTCGKIAKTRKGSMK